MFMVPVSFFAEARETRKQQAGGSWQPAEHSGGKQARRGRGGDPKGRRGEGVRRVVGDQRSANSDRTQSLFASACFAPARPLSRSPRRPLASSPRACCQLPAALVPSAPQRPGAAGGASSPCHPSRTLASSNATPHRRQRNLGRPHSGRYPASTSVRPQVGWMKI